MSTKPFAKNVRHTMTTPGHARIDQHKLPTCKETGLARYRDRRQARDGARALSASTPKLKASSFSCPSCRGFHLDEFRVAEASATPHAEPSETTNDSVSRRTHRYVLLDIENPTRGARASREEVQNLWSILSDEAPGLDADDHIVVGAAVNVARKYRPVLQASNIKWVVGANAPDGADCALLSAVNLHQVSKRFDELVIISGDHAFAPLARRAKQHGLRVHVVTAENIWGRSMLSRELSAVADIRTRIRFAPQEPMSATGRVLRQIQLATAA